MYDVILPDNDTDTDTVTDRKMGGGRKLALYFSVEWHFIQAEVNISCWYEAFTPFH